MVASVPEKPCSSTSCQKQQQWKAETPGPAKVAFQISPAKPTSASTPQVIWVRHAFTYTYTYKRRQVVTIPVNTAAPSKTETQQYQESGGCLEPNHAEPGSIVTEAAFIYSYKYEYTLTHREKVSRNAGTGPTTTQHDRFPVLQKTDQKAVPNLVESSVGSKKRHRVEKASLFESLTRPSRIRRLAKALGDQDVDYVIRALR